MRRRLPVLLGLLGLTMVLAVASGVASEGGDIQKGVITAELYASVSGRTVTYHIVLHNNAPYDISRLFIAGLVPAGAEAPKVAGTPVGAVWAGVEGSAATWVSTGIAAGQTQGPFRYQATTTTGPLAPAHAWVSWSGVTGGSTVSDQVRETDYPLATVRPISSDDNQMYPGNQPAITLTKSPHYAQKITTSGLPNAGLGEYVYLQGSERDAEGDRITDRTWELVKTPPYSRAALEEVDAKGLRLRLDTPGAYEVKVTVTDVANTKSSYIVNLNGGRYAGYQTCAECHNGSKAPDIYTPWAETGHASKFERTFASYSPTSDYCIRCHTVGYDEGASAGGFSDAAKAAGWKSVFGSFMTWVQARGLKLGDIKADPNMGKLLGIQCENCHGPGADAHTKAKSFEVGVCAQCHHQQDMWKYSGHAKPIYVGARGNADCVSCHTAQGYVEVTARGEEPVFPGMGPFPTLPQPASMTNITCVACHDPHRATEPYEQAGTVKSNQLRVHGELTIPSGDRIAAETAAVCVSCHANKRDAQYQADFIAGKQVRGVHDNPQADNLYAAPNSIFGYGGAIKPASSAHARVVKEACIECHMAPNPLDNPGPDRTVGTRDDVKVMNVGGHSFQVAGTWNFSTHQADPKGTLVQNVAVCQKCHPGLDTFNRRARADYDGNGKVEGVQDEVKGLLKALAARLPKDGQGNVLTSPISDKNTTEGQRKALWNYMLVANDGSYGVHNTGFAVSLLQQTYRQLTGTDIPGVTLR